MPIDITYLTDLVDNASRNEKSMTVAYVNSEGQPRLSLRGTTQVHGPDQLAFWVREQGGGLPNALSQNPNLALMYRDPPARTNWFFYGRGHIETDPAVAAAIYDKTSDTEKSRDPNREGLAVIVELDLVQGGHSDSRTEMRRS